MITAKFVRYGSQATPLPLEGRRKVHPDCDAGSEVGFSEVGRRDGPPRWLRSVWHSGLGS